MCEPELRKALRLDQLERALRVEFSSSAERSVDEISTMVPISNACQKVFVGSVEEAQGLGSAYITPGHLLLGILREADTNVARFLSAHSIHLSEARTIVAQIEPPLNAHSRDHHFAGFHTFRLPGASSGRRFSWMIVRQATLLIFFGFVLIQSSATAKQLLWLGGIWFIASIGWSLLRPAYAWKVKFRGRYRTIGMLVLQLLLSLYSFLLGGWLVPVVIGVWRALRG